MAKRLTLNIKDGVVLNNMKTVKENQKKRAREDQQHMMFSVMRSVLNRPLWSHHRVLAMPSKADALETAHGAELRSLARIHTTARRLKGALEERRPPLLYADGVLKQWLLKYGPGNDNAGTSAADPQQRYHFYVSNICVPDTCV